MIYKFEKSKSQTKHNFFHMHTKEQQHNNPSQNAQGTYLV